MTIEVTDIRKISVAAGGAAANKDSYFPVFSPDGSKVAFYSYANNLVPGDSNPGGNGGDVFVKDLNSGVITLASVTALGVQGNNASAYPTFSPDGSKVVFYSYASNLVPGDTNGVTDIFVKNLTSGVLSRISTDSSGNQRANYSDMAVFSPDGNKVAFHSAGEILIKNLITGQLDVVVSGGSIYGYPRFSPDGTKLAFTSSASNLSPGDGDDDMDVFVKDLVTGAVTLVSTAPVGQQLSGDSYSPSFSPDGTKIAFHGYETNAGPSSIYVRDLASGAVSKVSIGTDNSDPVFSPDGAHLVYQSGANIIMQDLNTNEIAIISTDPNGILNNWLWNDGAVISPDGTQVAFYSLKSPPGASPNYDVYLVTTNVADGIYGTGLADTLNGTAADDRIFGYQGNDTINGMGGSDTIEGGQGDDQIVAYAPDEEYPALPNTNIIYGNEGNDRILNGYNNGQLYGGDGNDFISSGGQTSVGMDGGPVATMAFLYGENGDDRIFGSGYLYGGDGNDTMGLDSGQAFGGLGNDIISAFGFADYDGYAVLEGIYVSGDEGNDSISGLSGTYYGGAGDDIIGVDEVGTYDISHASSYISGGAGDDHITTFMSHANNAYDFDYVDLSQANILDGDDGNDVISFNAHSRVSGGIGNDTIVMMPLPFDLISGDTETTNNFTGEAVAVSSFNVGSEIDGGLGFDTLIMGESTPSWRYNHLILNYLGMSMQNIEKITGNGADNIINLTNSTTAIGDIIIEGKDGNDTIWSHNGNDTIDGGNGNDYLRGAGGNDIIKGGAGIDRLRGDDGNDTITGDIGNDDVRGGAGDDNLSGGDGNDLVYGDAGADFVSGGAGNDDVRGGAGNDQVFGSHGDDRVMGGDGNDTLNGGTGNDLLYGENDDDNLRGGGGLDILRGGAGNDDLNGDGNSDTLYGDFGNDILNGGSSADRLFGGLGADTFVFDQTAIGTRDTIGDFNLAEGDVLLLQNLLTGYDPLTSAITDFVNISQSASLSYLRIDADGAANGHAFVHIARIDGVTGLTDEAALLASGNLQIA